MASLAWAEEVFLGDSSNVVTCEMFIDGEVMDTTTMDLQESRALPDVMDCGTAVVTSSGTHTISVVVKVDDSEGSYSEDYQSFKAGVSFVPLIIILILAATTQMVRSNLV